MTVTLGVLTYREAAGQVTLIHTEVPPELRGRGIADALARAALDDARQHGGSWCAPSARSSKRS